ncbi:hypothetical protein L2K20_03475 [Mycobacterium sp. MBM]|nr:hypothetical protein [Mycobacterium sp. MBM]
MTIDDLSRTDDMTDIGPPVQPWVEFHGADRRTAVVRGSVRVVDQGARSVRFGPRRGSTDKGGAFAVDAWTGQFSYVPSAAARQLSRTSPHYGDKVDTFTVDVDVDMADGHRSGAEAHVVVDILPADIALTGAVLIRPPSANGVLTGRIGASAWDGAALTFSLQNPANPPDSAVASAFSRRGGMVALDQSTGRFTFVPPICEAATPGPDTDTFVVTATDPRGDTADITVTVLARLHVEVQTLDIAPGVQRGRVLVDDDWPLSFGLGRAPTKGTALVDRSGVYTYTRTSGLADSAEDSFTILGADAHGRTMTVATVSVCPPLGDTPPQAAPAPPSAGVRTNTLLGGAKEAQWHPITVDHGCTLRVQSTSGGTARLSDGTRGDHTLTFTSSGGSFFTRGPAGTVVLRATDAVGRHADRTYTY